MNFGSANVRAITMAAVAFVIVPGIYVLASNAAANLVTGFSSTRSAGHSNRVALEAETIHVPAECTSVYGRLGQGTRTAWARCKAAEARVVKAAGSLQKQNGPEGPPASPADALRATRGVPPAR